MIYGDNPQKINEREDALGLKTHFYAPQISAIIQSGNLYVYCSSNPVTFADRSGKHQGLAHHWVVGDIVLKYSGIQMMPGLKIAFLPGYISQRGVKYGFADLISIKTGEVWEVKRDTISKQKAEIQLGDYTSNRISIHKKIPRLELIELCTGGSKGTRIMPATIVRFKRGQTYVINYWDAGNGIIYYDYVTYKTEFVRQNSEAFFILLSSGLLFSVVGGARIGIESVALEGN